MVTKLLSLSFCTSNPPIECKAHILASLGAHSPLPWTGPAHWPRPPASASPNLAGTGTRPCRARLIWSATSLSSGTSRPLARREGPRSQEFKTRMRKEWCVFCVVLCVCVHVHAFFFVMKNNRHVIFISVSFNRCKGQWLP